MTDVGSARVEVTGDVRNFARQTERDLDRALAKIKTPTIDIKADVDVDKGRAAAQFVKVGGEAAEALSGALSKGLGGLASSLGSNPYVAAAGAALAAGIVAALLPALGALLSGAVIGGAGLGVIGLGALLLKEEPALQAAGKRLTSALSKTFADAAKPLLGPLVAALGTFEKLIQRVTPQIREMFATLASSGAIESLATGLAGLVENALPGFLELLKQSGPLLVALGESLPMIGVALDKFFRAIADGGPGAALFFKDLVKFVAGAIVVLGRFVGWLASVYPAVRKFLIDAAAWVADATNRIIEFGRSVRAALAPLVSIFQGVWNAIAAVTRTSWGVIRSITTAGISAIRAVWTAGWSAMVSIVTGAAGKIRSVVSGLAATIRGAFAGAGGWLVDAGRRIIDGLISGIRSGFDRVRGLLGDLTSMLPSWKGPAEVDQRILERSGQMVMAGFERGLESRFTNVRKALEGLTADLPAFTAPTGASRGGDGASMASGRPIVIENHIEIGGEVVRVVRTEINEHDRDLDRQVSAGTGGFRL